MVNKISRKDFFKKSIKNAGIIGAATITLPPALKAASTKELATLVDLRKCIGCEACVYACQEVNGAKYPEPKKPFPKMFPDKVPVQDWSDKRDETDRLTPYNWLYIQKAKVNHNGKEIELNIPRRCMHCQNPPCANLCPFGSSYKHDNGITTFNPDLCMGGAKCKEVCPWHIPQRQTGVGIYLNILPKYMGNGVMYKCDRCHDKIKDGKIPACIEQCPEGVQKIGFRDDIVKEAHKIAKEINGFIYGEIENGGTNTIYVSPVPFEKLNKAIEKGDGKPHLKPVDYSMASADNFAKAMIIAPFAGVAAAILRSYKFISKNSKNEVE